MEALAPKDSATAAWALHHCAQSLACSLDGFPAMKPAPLRWLAGVLVFPRLLARGYLGHDLGAGVPGLPAPPAGQSFEDARRFLLATMDRFDAAKEPLAEHFLLGRGSKAQWDRYHAIHLAEHLEGLAS